MTNKQLRIVLRFIWLLASAFFYKNADDLQCAKLEINDLND